MTHTYAYHLPGTVVMLEQFSMQWTLLATLLAKLYCEWLWYINALSLWNYANNSLHEVRKLNFLLLRSILPVQIQFSQKIMVLVRRPL